MMRLLYFALTCVAAFAQQPEISGVVLELPTNYPIAGAEISLFNHPEEKTTTDSNGAFKFHPSAPRPYGIQIKKEGYRWTDANMMDSITMMSRGASAGEVRYYMVRLGGLTGRVVDEDTGQPIAGLGLSVVQISYRRGKRSVGSRTDVATDKDGRFVAPSLQPGNYVVTARPHVTGFARLVPHPTNADLNAIDYDYQAGYWPGGPDLDAAAPTPVAGGITLDLGTWKLRKVPSYRVHVSVSAPDCTAGDQAVLLQRGGDGVTTATETLSELPCDGDMLLAQYLPGSYWLEFDVAGDPSSRSATTLPIEVRDRNIDATATLRRGMLLEGRVIAAEGAGLLPVDRVQIRLAPEVGTLDGDLDPISPNAQGRFRIANMHFDHKQISVQIPDTSWYVKEIRYAGGVVNANVFAWDGAGALEIELDNQPPMITGTVADGDKPAQRPDVVLVRWPVSADDVFRSVVSETTGDDQGKFRVSGPIVPGDYRLIALPEAAKDKLQEPHVLERLLLGAEKATFDRAGAYNLSLKLSDPAR